MKYQYQNAYEQALRMIGFNPINETMAGDIASNDYANKQAEKRAKDDAIDAFIEEPTAENAARLNQLGVTPKSIAHQGSVGFLVCRIGAILLLGGFPFYVDLHSRRHNYQCALGSSGR